MTPTELRSISAHRRPEKHRESGHTLRPLPRLFAALALALSSAAMPLTALSAVFEVNDRTDFHDLSPGDGICDTGNLRINLPPLSVIPECTLRAAIEESNALAGADEIRFSALIPLIAGFAEIAPTSPLPPIEDEVAINGYSHPDYDSASINEIPIPVVQLAGSSVAGGSDGLIFDQGSHGASLLGVAIHSFTDHGVVIRLDESPTAPGITLQGNHIGASRGGFMFGNGAHGILVEGGASQNIIGKSCGNVAGCLGRGNLVSANELGGIVIRGSNNRVAGNFVGTDFTGTSDFVPFGGPTGNQTVGISVSFPGADNEIGSLGAVNLGGIGGATPVAAGNVVSANGRSGIAVNPLTTGTVIKANLIGTDRDGTGLLANAGSAIYLVGEAVIGDLGLGGNLIANDDDVSTTIANVSTGIFSLGTAGNSSLMPYSVSVIGNRIGVNADASETLGDIGVGILLFGNATRAAIEGNTIGGCETGIGGENMDIRENYIGTNAAGDDLGNALHGISGRLLVVGGEASDSPAVAASRGNVIAHSGDAGIGISSDGGAILSRGNFFRSNGGIPFDLGPLFDINEGPVPPDGPTANDVGDLDFGPNRLQNFPEFNSAQTSYDEIANEVTVRLRVDSLPTSSVYPIQVDLYARNPYADPEEAVGRLIGSVSIAEPDAQAFVTETFTPLAGAFNPDPITGDVYAELKAVALDAEGATSEVSREIVPVPEPGFGVACLLGTALLGQLGRGCNRHSRTES